MVTACGECCTISEIPWSSNHSAAEIGEAVQSRLTELGLTSDIVAQTGTDIMNDIKDLLAIGVEITELAINYLNGNLSVAYVDTCGSKCEWRP